MAIKTWCGKKVNRLKYAYVAFLARRLPTCEEIAPVISRNMDEQLSLPEKIKMILHNHICEWCKRYANQLLLLRQAAQKEIENSEFTLSQEARQRMKESLNEQ
jgi:hypothetical protein